ncbi:MAG: DUF2178 domain-containing protein [Phyllobacteriaceae bacterium]|nr:DUF2178 domain-containing protein [Phyllobacteriaceae bacterium]
MSQFNVEPGYEGSSWLERSWLAQTLRAMGVYAWFLSRQQGHYASGAFDAPDGLVLLGLGKMLLLIMVTMGVGLAVQIIFVILSVATGQETTDGIDDERDRHIEARATVHGFTLTGLGFLAAVLALWQGWGAVWAFNLMVGFMVASDVVVNLYKFVCYRQGI